MHLIFTIRKEKGLQYTHTSPVKALTMYIEISTCCAYTLLALLWSTNEASIPEIGIPFLFRM